MVRSATAPSLGSEYNTFLYASVGDDRNGMLLSVISALTRLDVDPWQEAAALTRLPVEAAIKRLSSLIAALADAADAHRDCGGIAVRLIALLPRGKVGSFVSPEAGSEVEGLFKFPAIAYVVFLIISLGA